MGPFMSVLQSYQSSYQKTDLPHENFTGVSHISFSGGKYFLKIFYWNFLSFRGLLYVLGHFKQKKDFFQKIFLTNLPCLFVDLLISKKPVLDWDRSLKTGKKD